MSKSFAACEAIQVRAEGEISLGEWSTTAFYRSNLLSSSFSYRGLNFYAILSQFLTKWSAERRGCCYGAAAIAPKAAILNAVNTTSGLCFKSTIPFIV